MRLEGVFAPQIEQAGGQEEDGLSKQTAILGDRGYASHLRMVLVACVPAHVVVGSLSLCLCTKLPFHLAFSVLAPCTAPAALLTLLQSTFLFYWAPEIHGTVKGCVLQGPPSPLGAGQTGGKDLQ